MADPVGNRLSHWQWAALAGLLLIATALRLHASGTSSYWLDELFALELSAGDGFRHESLPVNNEPAVNGWDCTRIDGLHLLGIWGNQVNDSHPPLYFVVLAGWRLLFGSSEVATRSLSLLFSVLTLVMVYLCVRSQSSARAALWTVAILAVSGTQIQYAQETRNYSMACVILYAVAWLILSAENARQMSPRRAIAIAAFLWAGFLTHYLFLPAAIGATLYGVMVLRDGARRMLLIACAGAAVLVAITWLPFLLQQRENGMAQKITWMGVTPGSSVLNTFALLQDFVWTNLLIDSSTPVPIRSILSLLLFFPLIGITHHRQLRIWVMIALAGLLAVILSDWKDGTNRLAVTRYTLLITPAIWASIVVFADSSKRLRHLLPALVVGLCLFRLSEVYVDRKADWRGIASWLAESSDERDVIIFIAPKGSPWVAGAMQAAIGHYARWRSAPRAMILDRPPTADILETIRHRSVKTRIVSLGTDAPSMEIGASITLERAFEPTLAIYRVAKDSDRPS